MTEQVRQLCLLHTTKVVNNSVRRAQAPCSQVNGLPLNLHSFSMETQKSKNLPSAITRLIISNLITTLLGTPNEMFILKLKSKHTYSLDNC